MLIAIDMRSIGQKLCGVSRMALNIVRALSRVDSKNKYILYRQDTPLAPFTSAANFTEKTVRLKRYSLGEHLFFREIVRRDMPDVFHSLHQSLPFFWNIPVKTIVTVCDLFAPKYNWFFEDYGYLSRNLARRYFDVLMRSTLRRADSVAAISQFTKKDLLERYHLPDEAVKVIHLAAGHSGTTASGSASTGVPLSIAKNSYCLFIGNFRRYKNIDGAIEAIATHNRKYPGYRLKLVVVGNDEKNLPRITRRAKDLNAFNDIVFLRYVPDAALSELYQNALCLLFPSLYEGFGMPILEAMQAGVPVVCADTTSLPEVAGDAALLINPMDPGAIAEALHAVMVKSELRQELISKGWQNAKRFTWEKTALEYLELYEGLMKGTAHP